MKLGQWLLRAAICGIAPAVIWSCATIMHGTSQEVSINSQPTGATVMVDGEPAGKTPVVSRLRRKDLHKITVTMDGYQPFEFATTRSTSGWVWGNIVFGGLIGLAVDAISGGLYNVKPEQIEAQLVQAGASHGLVQDGNIYVFLVRQPDPSWQKIGQLERAR